MPTHHWVIALLKKLQVFPPPRGAQIELAANLQQQPQDGAVVRACHVQGILAFLGSRVRAKSRFGVCGCKLRADPWAEKKQNHRAPATLRWSFFTYVPSRLQARVNSTTVLINDSPVSGLQSWKKCCRKASPMSKASRQCSFSKCLG